MDTPSELKEAVCRFQKGERKAFDEIYKLSYGYLFVCVNRLISDKNTVCDMLQETYFEISKSLGQLNRPERFLAWAARIAYRKCLAWLKKEQRLPVAEGEQAQDYLEEVADAEEFLPETILQNKEKQRLLQEMIDALPPVRKACIAAFYYYGLTVQQIAEEMELSPNTVKSHLSRGRKEIKAAVLELEERKGTRLYAMAPFFLLLLGMEAEACEVPELPRKLSGGRAGGLSYAGRVGVAALAAVVCVAAGAALYRQAGKESQEDSAPESLSGQESGDGLMGQESGEGHPVSESGGSVGQEGGGGLSASESGGGLSASESGGFVGQEGGDGNREDVPAAEEAPSYDVSLLEYLGLSDLYPWLGPDDVPMMATDDFLFVYTGVTGENEDSYIVYLGNDMSGTPVADSRTRFILYNGDTGERLVNYYIHESGSWAVDSRTWILPTRTNGKNWFRVLVDRENEAYDPENIVIAEMMFAPDQAHTNLKEETEIANFVWGYRPEGTIADVLEKIDANHTPFAFLPDGNIWWLNELSEYSVDEMNRLERYYQVQSMTGDTAEHLLEEFESHMKLGYISYGGGNPGDIAVDVDANRTAYSIDLSQVEVEVLTDATLLIGPFVINGEGFLPEDDTVTGHTYVLGYDDGEEIWYFW
ncbi:MAG: sigma-70 family RNA polymerase sigma factor [Butyrivibrio sp.]|nr:sigma-70 family RNA polymerase sigma factor [Acetatifactor muris]MCM1559069.1 sigma-70 family RNA polymerase sigma factor [Butyrivibrio sp.]